MPQCNCRNAVAALRTVLWCVGVMMWHLLLQQNCSLHAGAVLCVCCLSLKDQIGVRFQTCATLVQELVCSSHNPTQVFLQNSGFCLFLQKKQHFGNSFFITQFKKKQKPKTVRKRCSNFILHNGPHANFAHGPPNEFAPNPFNEIARPLTPPFSLPS